ncbi:MAG: hypothetical protein LBU65_03265 [Planctomycetaceae bacterium]|nr:hypothetical protein [Planctomycetaceae bacterium]
MKIITHCFQQIFLFIVLFSHCNMITAEEITPSMKKKVEMAFHGMDDSLLRINSGICRIVGHTTDSARNKKDENIFIAFDYSKKFYRCDNEIIRSLLTHEYYYEIWTSEYYSPTAERYPFAERRIASMLHMVDIQLIPFYSPIGVHLQYDYQEKHRKRLFLHKLLLADELPNNILHIKFEMNRDPGYQSVQAEYWLSKKYDYLPVHTEYSFGCQCDISWKNINHTWVPETYSQKSDHGYGVEWKIDWESVNEPVPHKYFDVTLLTDEEIPLYTTLESGESVKIGKFGPKPAPPPPLRPHVNWVGRFLMIAGTIMIIISIIKKIYDWRVKRNK